VSRKDRVGGGYQALDSIHSHVRRFKMQAQIFVACVQAFCNSRRWAWQEA